MSYKIQVIQAFEKAVRTLAKKYRSIKQDLERAVNLLEKDPHIGVAIPGYEGAIWKLRVANTSAKRGKQGGFRIIYLIEKEAQYCYLLTIYSKTEKTDVIPEEVEALLQSLEQEFFSDDSEAGEPDDAEASETLSKKR
jgi:mRNA-degrading endonuclease RelE of RelBE toxin-antitoxin system